jgi:hypothetical protein
MTVRSPTVEARAAIFGQEATFDRLPKLATMCAWMACTSRFDNEDTRFVDFDVQLIFEFSR